MVNSPRAGRREPPPVWASSGDAKPPAAAAPSAAAPRKKLRLQRLHIGRLPIGPARPILVVSRRYHAPVAAGVSIRRIDFEMGSRPRAHGATRSISIGTTAASFELRSVSDVLTLRTWGAAVSSVTKAWK